MTRHRNDHTTSTTDATSTTTSTTGAGRSTAAARVEAALTQLDRAGFDLGPLPTTDTGWASRSAAMAILSARRAGWWRVLLTDNLRTHTLPAVAERAVYVSYRDARDDAKFWRESAADWQARAEGHPTSDAAGALSNWHELGVMA